MFKKFHSGTPKKRRKYPIKRDERGKTARKRAFRLFDMGYRPTKVAPMVDVTLATSYTYFRDWKKLPKNMDLEYKMWTELFRTEKGYSPEAVSTLADVLGMSAEEVVERFQKPWGLSHLLLGRWPNPRLERTHNEQELRLTQPLRSLSSASARQCHRKRSPSGYSSSERRFRSERRGRKTERTDEDMASPLRTRDGFGAEFRLSGAEHATIGPVGPTSQSFRCSGHHTEHREGVPFCSLRPSGFLVGALRRRGVTHSTTYASEI